MDADLKCIDFERHPVVIDTRASEEFFNWYVDRCPTMTKARAKKMGFWVLPRNSYMSLTEIGALMGIAPGDVQKMRASGLPDDIIAEAMGNAQSVNVLERILGHRGSRKSGGDDVLSLSVCLVSLSLCRSVSLSLCLVSLSLCLSVSLSLCRSVCKSLCLDSLSCLSVSLSLCRSVSLSLPVCM